MIRRIESIPAFLGLRTDVHEQQQPLGSAKRVENMAQYDIGTLRRIPGIAVKTNSPGFTRDASNSVPLMFEAEISGDKNIIALFVAGDGTSAELFNLTTNSVMTGPAITGQSGHLWTVVVYNNKYMFTGATFGPIYQVDSASAYSAVTGTPSPPDGGILASFQNRLYVADIRNSLVLYSDALTTNFTATNLINLKELPGGIQAMAINAPSTDTLGIYTQLVIVKDQAIVVWDETSKDIVTQAIGSKFQHTFINTPAGLLFLGTKSGNQASVFLLPLGSHGEPIDVGVPLRRILNSSSGKSLLTLSAGPFFIPTAHAVLDGRFYKLWFTRQVDSGNINEVWLDVDALAAEQIPVWYGVHSRIATTGAQFSLVASGTSGGPELHIAKKGGPSTNKIFVERDLSSGSFVNDAGTIIEAEIEMSLNVPPEDDQRVMELIELRISDDTAVVNNTISTTPLSDGTALASSVVNLVEEASPSFIDRAIIPLRAPGDTGMTTYAPGVIITHSLDKRFDIIGMQVQYLHHEELKIKKVE